MYCKEEKVCLFYSFLNFNLTFGLREIYIKMQKPLRLRMILHLNIFYAIYTYYIYVRLTLFLIFKLIFSKFYSNKVGLNIFPRPKRLKFSLLMTRTMLKTLLNMFTNCIFNYIARFGDHLVIQWLKC